MRCFGLFFVWFVKMYCVWFVIFWMYWIILRKLFCVLDMLDILDVMCIGEMSYLCDGLGCRELFYVYVVVWDAVNYSMKLDGHLATAMSTLAL